MIQALFLSQLSKQCGGALKGEDKSFDDIAIDSRTLNQGDLYFALKGDKYDGHDFIPQALEKGCLGVVYEREYALDEQYTDISAVRVRNTQAALGQCALLNRQNFSGSIVGLTGSSGKTSTKNILEQILLQKGPTCATQGNFNNEIGVPLTLLRIKKDDRYAVVEMGARKKGDIEYLSQFVQPDVAILLNAGTAHIDIFGSKEAIVSAKGEIFTSLKEGAKAVVNLDDPAHQIWLDSLIDKACLTYSLSNEDADVFASNISLDGEMSRFSLNYLSEKQEVSLPLPGMHSIANSLAASAAAIHLGFELPVIAKGLSVLEATKGRLNAIEIHDNLTLIDDAYNANPSSMKAGLDVLCVKPGRKIAILGEMAELGAFSERFHLELAAYIAGLDCDKVYLIGTHAQKMANKIGGRAYAASSKQEILNSLDSLDGIFEKNARNDSLTTILVKGSRSSAMDELVDLIVTRAAQ